MASKGCLAVVGACADGQAVAMATAYIRQWYGYRAGQCRALVRMLGWIRDPRAANQVLAIARRFRTRSIREEAEEAMRDLATRHGWTLDELADRCVPDAGLDRQGHCIYQLGDRVITMRLGSDLKPDLSDADGKRLKALPSAGTEAEQAAAALGWKELKAELKAIIPQQRLRLYEAMCRRRIWPVGEWREFLLGHPILARLCQRLVWIADGYGVCRPDRDGSCIGEEDRSLELPASAAIRIAHALDLTAAQRAIWSRHLVDYEVEPLFDQFGREPMHLSAETPAGEVIADRKGWCLPFKALRAAMLGAGYVRGPVGDGPSFCQWRRSWGGLGLYSEIGFSGMSLPERDLEVAISSLSFHRSDDDEDAAPLPLASLPPVLLSECWNDYRAVAGQGSFSQRWHDDLA
jgi:hypothetical protein